MPRSPSNLSRDYRGAKIRAYGRQLFATLPGPRGQGRKRKYAAPTPEGLATLQKWVDSEIRKAAGVRELSPAEVADAVAALATLPPGVSLLQAAQAYAAPSVVEQITLGEAREAYLASLAAAGRRPATIQAARHGTAGLLPWASSLPSAIGFAEAEILVRAHRAAVTQNGIRRVLSGFWGWMIRRHFAAENPFCEVEKAFADEKPVGIYSPAAVAALFATAEASFPALLPPLALAFFSGVRTSGLNRLRPGDIRLAAGEICLPGWASKTRRAYFAPISPTLRAWLQAYPPRAYGPLGAILPGGESRWHDAFRRLARKAGVAVVPNGARHSFATYTFAASGDALGTAAAMGHFGAPETLIRHYRALADKQAAAEFFAVLPRGKVGLNLVSTVSVNPSPEPPKQPENTSNFAKTPR